RLSRAAPARVQVAFEKWITRDVLVFSSRERRSVQSNDCRRAGGRAPVGAKTSAIRTSARSSSAANNSGDRIFQRRSVGNDAGALSASGAECHPERERRTSHSKLWSHNPTSVIKNLL